ncbi:unnamed protein product [Sphenostylis stenocarpa]|uniref:Uncharacterized protein n=1 Tax=Sphenostylis stenocarpa TaxID=92480 RepID=A0AA86S1Y2_9FABA|nr:unnamed protein product [Sphenostylis stenocarpa]
MEAATIATNTGLLLGVGCDEGGTTGTVVAGAVKRRVWGRLEKREGGVGDRMRCRRWESDRRGVDACWCEGWKCNGGGWEGLEKEGDGDWQIRTQVARAGELGAGAPEVYEGRCRERVVKENRERGG